MKTVTKKEYILLSFLYKVTVIKANDDMALVKLEKKCYYSATMSFSLPYYFDAHIY